MEALLYPLAILSAVGLILSLTVHVLSLTGVVMPDPSLVWMLHMGIFVVWIPAVFVAQKLVSGYDQKNYWKAVLRGCPPWMKTMVYVFFGYAFVNFFVVFILNQPDKGAAGNNSPETFRGFSGHWIAFYSAGAAILYSATQADMTDRRRKCINGHVVPVTAGYCP